LVDAIFAAAGTGTSVGLNVGSGKTLSVAGTLSVTGSATVIEFADGSAAAPSITNDGDTNTGIFFPAADTIAFSEGGVEAMRIDSSGRVGIGITSPSVPLHVQANSSGLSLRVQGRSSDGYSDISLYNNANTVNNAFFGSSNTATFLGTGAAIPLTFQTNNAEVGRFDSSGNLMVGTTTSGGKLSVAGNISVQGGDSSVYRVGGNTWTFFSSNTGYNSNGYHLKLDSSTSAGFASFFTVATETIRFDGSGNASKSSGAGSWLALSDKRIKENIAPVQNGLQRICLLKPSTFDYKQPNAHQGKTSDKGFIADDFSEVYPNSIVETDFIAEDDKQYFEEGSLAKSMGFNAEFYADLVAAIQEQQALIQSLTTRITALESK
jgi:hypothetical protein